MTTRREENRMEEKRGGKTESERGKQMVGNIAC